MNTHLEDNGKKRREVGKKQEEDTMMGLQTGSLAGRTPRECGLTEGRIASALSNGPQWPSVYRVWQHKGHDWER
jgi:hypothetical protein